MIEYRKVKIEECNPNNYNPNEMTERQMKHLVKEIKRVGFLQPILLNKDMMIIDGYHRWLAAKEAGMTEIPAIITNMDLKTAKTTTITMNQIKGEINPIKFAELLESLQEDFDLNQLSEILDMSELEIESYNVLLNLEDSENLGSDNSSSKEMIICPYCEKKFLLEEAKKEKT